MFKHHFPNHVFSPAITSLSLQQSPPPMKKKSPSNPVEFSMSPGGRNHSKDAG